ncbi:MAG TPA: TAXI family TRAP transporter solute-binding subunit, partial [Rhodopila sp.]|nr:TAXI family TRAP transporter solute-binding subunit [Rhodopila sp.]
RRITTLEALNDQPVEIGSANSGTAFTAKALLDALHIRPAARHSSPFVALDRLRLGQAAAMVVVGGKPVPALLEVPPASGLHCLPIPLNAQLMDTYLPSNLDSPAYPNLVPLGQTVDTVAVGSMLITIARQPDTPRAKRVDRFIDTLFARFAALRRPGFHPKWHEVSLSAQIPGLRRYPEAEKLLRSQTSATQPGRERHSGP